MKKIKMVRGTRLTFEEGCNKYLEYCRQRNLREGTVNHYKEIVMNDPKLRAVIEKLAEGTGFSPEEYYDHFDAMLKEYPEILDEILEKGLRDQRKRFENE